MRSGTTGCNAGGSAHRKRRQPRDLQAMPAVKPKITWREWLIAPAYQQAEQ